MYNIETEFLNKINSNGKKYIYIYKHTSRLLFRIMYQTTVKFD